LQVDPIADGPKPIAQVQRAGGLNTGKNPGPWHRDQASLV